MFDPRIYRAALIPAVAAFVLMMFSLEPVPNPLEPPVSTPTFEAGDATRIAREIVAVAPNREPGSEGDRAAAELVRERFEAIEGGQVSTQDFSSSFDGADVDLQNVLLTIPGASGGTLLVVAARDAAEGEGAATSAAATGLLVSLAENLAAARRERTLIFASTAGGSDGASGAEELVDALPATETIGAAVVISQPGADPAERPHVITSGTEPESVSPQLAETARVLAAGEFGEREDGPGAFGGLARLAVPIGLGEQAALRRAGLEAIAISGAGERALSAEEAASISTETLALSGGTTLSLLLTLDEAERGPAPGPDEYIRLGDNLIPGWVLSLLAIALIVPPLLAAADTWLREQRLDWRTRRTLFWALERALVPFAALLLAYLLGLIGLVPDPRFPYDPARFPPGAAAPVAFVVLAAAAVLAALLIRPMRTPLDSEAHTLAAAAGIVCGGALVGIWLLNPYLALLLFPAAHVWLLPARAAGPPRAALIAAVALLSLMPAFAALASVSAQLDLGLAAPWHLLLMIEDGQIGFGTSLLWCAMLGGLLACVTAAGARGVRSREAAPIRGMGSHAGPGALGSIPSSVPRR